MKTMRLLTVALVAAVLVIALAGCPGGDEIKGITKPKPNIKWANVFRSSSSAAVQTNRIEFWMTEFAAYRLVGDNRVYLDFQYVRAEASGDGGRAIYVLSNWSHEALQSGYTYFVLAGIGAYVYDYDAQYLTRASRETAIADKIASTRSTNLGRPLTEAEQAKVNKLAGMIAEEQERQKSLDEKRQAPVHVDLRPAGETRSSEPLTDAYDAGLWQCNPDGSSQQIL